MSQTLTKLQKDRVFVQIESRLLLMGFERNFDNLTKGNFRLRLCDNVVKLEIKSGKKWVRTITLKYDYDEIMYHTKNITAYYQKT